MKKVNPFMVGIETGKKKKINPFMVGYEDRSPKKTPSIDYNAAAEAAMTGDVAGLFNRPEDKETIYKRQAQFWPGVLEDATLGIPRAILKKTLDIDLPRGSMEGQIVGSLLPTSGILRLIKSAGIPLKGLTGYRTAQKTGLWKRLPEMLKASIMGAAISQTPTVTELDATLPERLESAAKGAVLAPVAQAALKTPSFIRSGVREIKKIRKPRRLSFQDRLKYLKTGEEKGIKTIAGQKIKDIKDRYSKSKEIIEDSYKESKEMLDKLRTKTARKEAVNLQKNLNESFREGKNTYGKILNTEAEIVNKTNPVKRKDIEQVIKKTNQELDDLFITEGGRPRQTINTIEKSLDIKDVNMGRRNAEKVVDLRRVLEAPRAVRRQITAPAQRGTAGMTEEDIAAVIFNKNMGEMLSTKSDRLSKIQGQYAEMADLMKDAYRTAKIGKGSRQAPEALIERVAQRRVLKEGGKGGEVESIARFEKGTKISPSIPRATEKTEKFVRQGRKIANKYGNDVKKLQREKQRLIDDIENQLSKRLIKTEEREKLQKQLSGLKYGTRNLIGSATKTASVIGGAIYALNLLKQQLNNQEEFKTYER